MENVINGNMRVLIGQYLGESYLVIQRYINNKWQHSNNNKYRGNYFVEKKLKELLNGSVHSIRKNNKNDMIKFRISHNTHVYISDYSLIKNYPELKDLNRALIKGVIGDKVSNQVTLVRTKHKQLSENGIMKILATTCLSIGILETLGYCYLEKQNQAFNQEINTLVNLASNQSIIENQELETKNADDQIIDALALGQIGTTSIAVGESLEKVEVEEQLSETEQMIQEYADLYFMDYKTVSDIYNANYEEIVNSDNSKQTFIIKVKEAFYLDETIDKESIVTDLNSIEKEDYIIHMAKDIYQVHDENTLALLLAIHRLETYWGESDRCIYDNNPGGVKEGNDFLSFKTFEIGTECFVRNTLKIKHLTTSDNDETNIEYKMQQLYCEGDNTWAIEIKDMKESILNNNELDSYLNKDNKTYIKK